MTMAGQPEDVDPALGQLQAMLQAQHQRAQAGVEDPLQFRLMFRHNWEETAEDTECNRSKWSQGESEQRLQRGRLRTSRSSGTQGWNW